MKKNFENVKELLKNVSVNFSAICLSEPWCQSQEESQNLNCILSSYSFFSQHRQYRRGGCVCVFFERIVFFCKNRQDLSINCDAIDSLCLQIINSKT